MNGCMHGDVFEFRVHECARMLMYKHTAGALHHKVDKHFAPLLFENS
jgi:hypothetical protein